MHLKIVNFEKFNPRKDRTHHHWFRLENNIIVSDALHELDPDQKWFWIFLLAYVSQKQTVEGVEVTPSLFSHLSGLKTKRVNETLELFAKRGLVTMITSHGNHLSPTDTERGLHNITEQDITNITIQTVQDTHTRKPSTKVDLPALAILWNLNCGNLSKVVKTTAERNKKATLRLTEHSEAEWKEIVLKIANSPFCNGESESGWKATFDWLLKPDTALRVLEGKYDPSPNRKTKSRTTETTRNTNQNDEINEILGSVNNVN